jgi:hypothetical protein
MEYVATKKLASDKNTQDSGSPLYVQIQDQHAIMVDGGFASVTKHEGRENDFVLPNAVEDEHRRSQSSKLSVLCVSLRVLPRAENSVNRSGAKFIAYSTI